MTFQPKLLKTLAGSSKPNKSADKVIKDLVDRYNLRNPENTIDLSLNAFIMIICRLHDSVKLDPNFKGGYNEMADVIRRHLFNRLNLCTLYKSSLSSEDDPLEG